MLQTPVLTIWQLSPAQSHFQIIYLGAALNIWLSVSNSMSRALSVLSFNLALFPYSPWNWTCTSPPTIWWDWILSCAGAPDCPLIFQSIKRLVFGHCGDRRDSLKDFIAQREDYCSRAHRSLHLTCTNWGKVGRGRQMLRDHSVPLFLLIGEASSQDSPSLVHHLRNAGGNPAPSQPLRTH